ncbi:MAG: maleylpyruvate isomerase N-terminal domain-containing protein [Candidatus Dormiibacterota bacterium]
MDFEEWLRQIQSSAERLASVSDGLQRAPVPSCPGWTVADLQAHLTNVLSQKVPVLQRPTAAPPRPEEWQAVSASDGGLGEAMLEAASAVVEALANLGPGAPVWSWYRPDHSSSFWARRLGHETAIHLVDAQLAAGMAPSCNQQLAADGVGELLQVFLARPGRPLTDGRPEATLHLHGDDADCEWTARLGADGVAATAGHYVGDCQLGGPVCAIYLWGWGRQGRDSLRLEGDPLVPARFRHLAARAT